MLLLNFGHSRHFLFALRVEEHDVKRPAAKSPTISKILNLFFTLVVFKKKPLKYRIIVFYELLFTFFS